RPVALSLFIRYQTSCANTPRILPAPRPNIFCKTFRRCSSPFSAKPLSLRETARLIRRPAFPRTTRDEKRRNAHRKRFDGRDGGTERRPVWRVDRACGLELSGERLSIQTRFH